MIMPGGMIAPPTSRADKRMFTKSDGTVMPLSSIRSVDIVTAASCGRVTSGCIPGPASTGEALPCALCPACPAGLAAAGATTP